MKKPRGIVDRFLDGEGIPFDQQLKERYEDHIRRALKKARKHAEMWEDLWRSADMKYQVIREEIEEMKP